MLKTALELVDGVGVGVLPIHGVTAVGMPYSPKLAVC